jgi:hypothetical protein
MSAPIVFISHFRVKDGAIATVREMMPAATSRIDTEKPGTAAMAGYLSDDGSTLSIVHLFPDATAMDRHFEGSEQRSAAAYEVITPLGWEIYGPASAEAVQQMRDEASAAGVPLTLRPQVTGGFLRATTPSA